MCPTKRNSETLFWEETEDSPFPPQQLGLNFRKRDQTKMDEAFQVPTPGSASGVMGGEEFGKRGRPVGMETGVECDAVSRGTEHLN